MREGWKTAKIEDIAQVVNGGTPKTKVPEYWDGDHLWITPAEMGGLASPYIESSRRKLSDAGLKDSSASLLTKNSVILSTRAPIGHLVINAEPMAFNQGCRGLIPRADVDSKYLYYFLYGSVELLNALGSGTTFKELSAGKLKKVELPLPPLPEQKRIVAILDEAFAGIATAVANTEKNLANARELFESYLATVASDEKQLGKYVRIVTGKLNANAAVENGQYPFFTCSREVSRIDDYAFDCEAILLAGNNASGDFNVKHYAGKFNAYQRTYVITVNDESRLAYRYLYFQLLRSLKQLKKGSVGAGTKFLKLDMIKNLPISIPSMARQREVLSVLDSLDADVSRIGAIYEEKLKALAELRQSLLQKAFSGELTAVPQDEIEDALA